MRFIKAESPSRLPSVWGTRPPALPPIFSTAADGQTQVEVNVLQGEREFARDNKQLGLFRLDGIAPAPRGIPQIEVSFDIDANGIVNVSAKDLGTGKEQHITITSSSNMSKEDIDKAVKEAEQFASEDKKRREEVDTRNNAENMCYQAEKLVKDNGDKMDAADKSAIEGKVSTLKQAISGNDAAAIKKGMEELEQVMMQVGQKMYQQQAPQQGPQQPSGPADPGAGAPNGNVYDADYREIDDDKK